MKNFKQYWTEATIYKPDPHEDDPISYSPEEKQNFKSGNIRRPKADKEIVAEGSKIVLEAILDDLHKKLKSPDNIMRVWNSLEDGFDVKAEGKPIAFSSTNPTKILEKINKEETHAQYDTGKIFTTVFFPEDLSYDKRLDKDMDHIVTNVIKSLKKMGYFSNGTSKIYHYGVFASQFRDGSWRFEYGIRFVNDKKMPEKYLGSKEYGGYPK